MAISIALVCVFCIYAYRRQRSIVSPFFLVTLSLLLGLVLIALNIQKWAVVINNKFIACIAIALVGWLLGSASYLNIGEKKKDQLTIRKFDIPKQFINHYPYLFMLLLCVLLTIVFSYKILNNIDLSLGFSNVLREIYSQKITSSSGNILFHQVDKIVVTIAYISYLQVMLLSFSDEKIVNKKIKLTILSITIIIAFIVIFMGTDRNVFIRYAIYCICLFVFFYLNNYKKTPKLVNMYSRDRINAIIAVRIGCIGVVLVILFYLMGKAKNYTSDFSRMISIYAGSGLYNFNIYLNSTIEYTHGASTFRVLLGVLNYFKLTDVRVIEDLPLIVIETPGYVYASNIYSTLQPFYEDFGMIGVFAFSYIMGIFFEWLYYIARKGEIYHKVVYAVFIYPTIYFSIADQFFGRMHLGLVYEVFWLLVFLYVLYIAKIKKYKHYQRIKSQQDNNAEINKMQTYKQAEV